MPNQESNTNQENLSADQENVENKEAAQEQVAENQEAVKAELEALAEKIQTKIDELNVYLDEKKTETNTFYDYASDKLPTYLEKINDGIMNYSEVSYSADTGPITNLTGLTQQTEKQLATINSLYNELKDKVDEVSTLATEYGQGREKAKESGLNQDEVLPTSLHFAIESTKKEAYDNRDNANHARSSVKEKLVEFKSLDIKSGMR
jgi:chromosome segregation ATPase